MGLFDDIKKTLKDSGLKDSLGQAGKDFDKAVQGIAKDVGNSDLGKEFKKEVKDIGDRINTTTKSTKKTYSIPDEYKSFPQYMGTINNLDTKNIDKYHRCTIDYINVTDDSVKEYISKIKAAGFSKGSDVRYDKDNTYIILEHEGTKLHLVFHVKH